MSKPTDPKYSSAARFNASKVGHSLDSLIDHYRANGLDPDDTTVDMYILRAVLELKIAIEPVVKALLDETVSEGEELQDWLATKPDEAGGLTVEEYLRKIRRLSPVRERQRNLRGDRKRYLKFIESIEKSHHKVIRAVRIRSEIRELDRKASEITVLKEQLGKLMTILQETLPPASFQGLQRRMVQDLDKVPDSLKNQWREQKR